MALMPSPMPGGPAPGPPGGVGAATPTSAMPGNTHQGMAKLKTALTLLTQAVSEIPMGSPLHAKTLKFIADVSKEMGQQQEEVSDVRQQVAQMARQGPNPDQQAAMQRMFPPQQGAAPPMAA